MLCPLHQVLPRAGPFSTGIVMRLSIERAALLKALGHVQNVVERRNTIPILSNVLMSAEGGKVTLVATDLDIEISEDTAADVGAPGQITAPAHTLYDIARKLPDGAQVSLQINADDRLDIDAGRSHFTLPLLPSGDFPKMTADGFTHNFVMKAPELRLLTSKLIDGTFPDYERVIPKGNEKELTIDNKVFADAVDRVATISAEKSRSIKIALSQDNLALTVNNPESGNAHEELMVDYAADPLEIGFNAKYLLDVAGQIEGRDATFFLDSPASPALVKDAEDPGALFVLMPLRV